jgi:hypothetical protein
MIKITTLVVLVMTCKIDFSLHFSLANIHYVCSVHFSVCYRVCPWFELMIDSWIYKIYYPSLRTLLSSLFCSFFLRVTFIFELLCIYQFWYKMCPRVKRMIYVFTMYIVFFNHLWAWIIYRTLLASFTWALLPLAEKDSLWEWGFSYNQ